MHRCNCSMLAALSLYTIDKGQPVKPEVHTVETAATDEAAALTAEGDTHAEEGGASAELCHACEVVPFLRGSATDLELSLCSGVHRGGDDAGVTVCGHWVQAISRNFSSFSQLVSGGPFGIINFAVGFLELILEFAKILSFGFRLFGNIFAGALLLSIVGALTAVVVPPGCICSKYSSALSRLMCSSCWRRCSSAWR